MKYRGYFYVAVTTTLNIILNGLTFGRYIWLEGRVRKGIFRNWGRRPPREVLSELRTGGPDEHAPGQVLKVFGSGWDAGSYRKICERFHSAAISLAETVSETSFKELQR